MEPPPLHPPQFPYVPPPLQNDAEHLNLLALFHFIFGGLALLGLGFQGIHFMAMRMVFTRSEANGAMAGSRHMPPEEIFAWIVVAYGFFALLIIAVGVANVLSGIWLRQRKNRTFSLVLAGFNCLQMPFGTALGVFTFIVLGRPSVRHLYGEKLV